MVTESQMLLSEQNLSDFTRRFDYIQLKPDFLNYTLLWQVALIKILPVLGDNAWNHLLVVSKFRRKQSSTEDSLSYNGSQRVASTQNLKELQETRFSHQFYRKSVAVCSIPLGIIPLAQSAWDEDGNVARGPGPVSVIAFLMNSLNQCSTRAASDKVAKLIPQITDRWLYSFSFQNSS